MVPSADTGHVDLEWAIGLNRFGLKAIGLWPETGQSVNEIFVSNFRVFFIFTSVTAFLIIPEIFSLVRVWGDMILIIDNLQTSLPIMSTMVKVLILWWKKEAVSPVVSMVANDWLKLKTAEERESMKSQARIARIITISGYGMVGVSVTILFILPCFGYSMRQVTNFTDPGRPLPVQSYYFYDLTKKSTFQLTFLGQSICLIMTALCYTVIDNFLGLLILHACGQMDNLKLCLTNLAASEDVSLCLSFSIKEHVRLIRFVNIVENTFNLMLLGQVLYFGILFCFQGFLLIHVINKGGELPIARLLWLIVALLTAFAHMFLHCFVGERLVARCDGIHGAAYECTWYVLEPKEAKKLILLMGRARLPLYITAGKIFPMTLPVFCALIKTSAGYISVLMAACDMNTHE